MESWNSLNQRALDVLIVSRTIYNAWEILRRVSLWTDVWLTNWLHKFILVWPHQVNDHQCQTIEACPHPFFIHNRPPDENGTPFMLTLQHVHKTFTDHHIKWKPTQVKRINRDQHWTRHLLVTQLTLSIRKDTYTTHRHASCCRPQHHVQSNSPRCNSQTLSANQQTIDQSPVTAAVHRWELVAGHVKMLRFCSWEADWQPVYCADERQ